MSEWVTDFQAESGETVIEHLGGVAWYEAPIPKRLHRCKAQTRGVIRYFTPVIRCACGGINIDGLGWSDRNQRRRSVARERVGA